MNDAISYLRQVAISSLAPLLPDGYSPACEHRGVRRPRDDAPRELQAARLEARGLASLFSFEALGARRAVCVSSVSDEEGAGMPAFAEKDFEVLGPVGSPAEELLAWASEGLGVGWCCRKGRKPSTPNQDSYCVVAVEGDFLLTAVLDGHGMYGHDVSQVAMERLLAAFFRHEARASEPGEALRDSFAATQAFLEDPERPASPSCRSLDASNSGTTCTVAYLDLKRDRLTVGHVGDSRAVLAGRASSGVPWATRDVTVDHKPQLPAERARIEGASPPGRVVFDGQRSWRVLAKRASYPGLNMSRALGDIRGHEGAGLCALPDIAETDLAEERKQLCGGDGGYPRRRGGPPNPVAPLPPLGSDRGSRGLSLVLCSDGVWDYVSSSEAFGESASKVLADPQTSAHALAKESYRRWMKNSSDLASDDITAVYMRMP